MLYKELNLRKLRDENGLDFAHYTYKKGMCSCCYGPKDLAPLHWKGQKIPEGDDYTYLLFKNADNGSGYVKANDKLDEIIFIEWDFSMDKLHKVCVDLKAQLTDEFMVLEPSSTSHCIVIVDKDSVYKERYANDKDYTIV